MQRTAFAIRLSIATLGFVAAVGWQEPAAGAAVAVARATEIPACAVFVDASSKGGDGSAAKPFATIGTAIDAAEAGAIICVAEGTYPEQLAPGEKHFTLAGGFQRGKGFKVRDSAAFVSKAAGKGGTFLKIEDPAPKEVLTAIDGFEITGYQRAIVRDFYESQRFDLTNNHIHDNDCRDNNFVGAGFALNNVTGTIKGNVIARNACGRGGAGFLNDSTNSNAVTIADNLIDGNSGVEPDSAHGGALYLFGKALTITGNVFTGNRVTQWGAGLYVGAYTEGGQFTTATMSGNVYRGNKAGNSGGGFFCDDGATCVASNEIYDSNCGGNVMVDGGPGGSGPTTSRFDHITSVGALEADCKAPGAGFYVNTYEAVAADSHTITNSIFWGNGKGRDFLVGCGAGNCKQLKVSVSQSMAQTSYGDGSIKITFGGGMVAPADPMFVAPEQGDFKLSEGSPARGKGAKGSDLGASVAGGALTAVPVKAAPAARPATAPAPVNAVPEAENAPAADAVSSGAKPALADKAVTAKEAYAAARDIGTADAWRAFLKSYPDGFYADMARAQIKKLGQAD